MDKHTIVRLKKEGHSNRSVARLTGIDRKTVARYQNEFNIQNNLLYSPESDLKVVQEALVSKPSYDTSKEEGNNSVFYTLSAQSFMRSLFECFIFCIN